MPSRYEWIGVLVILVGLMALLLSGPLVDHHLHSCALCRLNRSDYRSIGLTWSDINETECSEWYRGHVETEHEHLWIPSRSGSMRNAFGTPYGAWDNAKDRGVFRLRPRDQIKVYQKAPDFGAAKQLFGQLGEAMLSDDESVNARVAFNSSLLAGWVDSGFKTSWNSITSQLKSAGE